MHLQRFICLVVLMLAGNCLQAQIINNIPAILISKEMPLVGTSFYLPDSNKIMLLKNRTAKFYNINGKETGESFNIDNNKADLLYPRISPSGKMIAFYTPSEEYFGDAKISIYNRDSGFVTGSYKVPGSSELKRFRFSGDSLLQYYVSFSDFDICFVWHLLKGKVNRFTINEDSVHSGIYDMGFYNNRTYVASRYRDSIVLATLDMTEKDKAWTSLLKTSSVNSKLHAQFSQGYPYLLLSDEGLQQTTIFKGADTALKEILNIKKVPEIIASAGDESHCYVLYNDSTTHRNDNIQLLEAVGNTTISLPFSYNQSKNYIFNIYPNKNILTASHVVDGGMAAYSLTDGARLWSFIPPVETQTHESVKQDSLDSKLFKVLIKQGSGDAYKSYFDKSANHFYLIKNKNTLVTVDADAKCAIKWEYFYRGNNNIAECKLLPGFRYVLYTEERWQKEENAMSKNLEGKMELNVDIQKNDQWYPYCYRVYDRLAGKDVFIMLSKAEANPDIINDSLIAFMDKRNQSDGDSILVYNLNNATAETIKPTVETSLGYTAFPYKKQLYFFTATLNDDLKLFDSKGKELFRRHYTEQSNLNSKVHTIANSPYFYLDAANTKTGMEVFKMVKDTVVAVKKLRADIDVLATKASDEYCYFLYKKVQKRKSGDMNYYYLTELISGTDKIIDSVLYDNDHNYANYELFPEDNYFLQHVNNIVVWRDIHSGYPFKNFGGDEATIVSLVYSPDGRYLAAANPNGRVMLWDLGTGKETKTLQVEKDGYITKLAFSGDGKWLAASSGDIWETATGKNVVSVTDGRIWAVESIDFSEDGKRIISGGACIISWDAADGSKLYFQQRPGKNDMDSTDTCWNPDGCVNPDFPFMVHSTAFHPNSRDFVTGNVSGLVQKWNTENRTLAAHQFLLNVPGQQNKIYDIKYSRDGKYVFTVQDKVMYKLDGNNLQVLDSLLLAPGETILGIDMAYDSLYFGCISNRNNIRVVQIRNIKDLSIKNEFYTEGASFNKITFSPNKKQAATSSENGFCTIWDIESGKAVMYLNTIGEYGNIMVTPDNFYMASKSALDGVSFSKEENFYSFDQFDLYLNRPDIVLSRLGYASAELINFYRSAYLKRLKKATGSISDTTIKDYVPLLALTNKKNIPQFNKQASYPLHFTITDSLMQKGMIKIFINGNLVKQHVFAGVTATQFTFTDSVLFSQGVNNIEAVYANHLMVESRKEKITISHSPAKPVAAKVWFIGIGVSKYKMPELNLKYPAKDVRDLAAAFKKKYPGLSIDTLIDAKATKENIIALRQKLMSTNVNDKVIVSFNGHGLLSDSLDWYFATHDIDIKKPELAGLSYGMMEDLLQGIPARQKLLLLDACHSGEVDKEKDITFANKETGMEQNVVSPATARGTIVIGKSKAGLQTSFEMMQELFANLNNGNGATVLSAAGGKEYALESDEWKNGVFTYSVLKALKDPSTDEDNDKKISVKELKKAVFNAVKTLTGGRQKPTSRVEVLDDWNVW